MSTYTPMMQQYLKIKADYKDSFLFFRLGDFYEMFFDDALKAAQELEITLTARDGGGDKIPMCGVPYHSSENYIKQLVEKGYKIAVCEQVEDPKQAKGVVKREVVQLITPGTVMEGSMLEEKENNFLAAVSLLEDHSFGLSYADLTTGETSASYIGRDFHSLIGELYHQPVKEIVMSREIPENVQKEAREKLDCTVSFEEETHIPADSHHLVNKLSEELTPVFGRLYNYISRTQKRAMSHLQPVQYIEIKDYMRLDMYSKRNLELTETLMKKGKKGSLLSVIDSTVTAMGARLLKKWIDRPLLDESLIQKRQEIVQGFMDNFLYRDAFREDLTSVYDLERLAGRVAFGNINAKDMLQLKRSLQKVPSILTSLSTLDVSVIQTFVQRMDPMEELAQLLENSVHEDAKLTIREGNIIKSGYSESLDEYRDAQINGKKWIADLEKREKELTGIRSLKIKYNKVFGYFIEVTRANLTHVPERYERKQTLANAERFITPELKEKETTILQAEEKSIELEYELFLEIRELVKGYVNKIQQLAKDISELDVLQGFSYAAEMNGYERPSFSSERTVHLVNSRHPVVEKVMEDEFVPNDIYMDESTNIFLITGPNMSGKSTYMRQMALTSVLAQIGSFVPCEEAVLPVFDQIFTRIGAADDLISGQSTFMVEMLEANNAITHATNRSMILFDEIGRGTSTYDGMALAQSIVEYIHENIKAKTLFSTHYHELTTLESELGSLKNVHVRAEEVDGKVVFLHQVKEGAADKSYGIHVAELAELPSEVITRAERLLEEFESQDTQETQLSLFHPEPETPRKQGDERESEVRKELSRMELMEMTPMEAMNALYRLQKMVK
ncbi:MULTISPECIES: DNA mismatch repair protein MutS [Salimicrobium]|uniref:DNA mismatch repair protein MutS n=1 Tax=Salimicrobium humidisoli TaxID=2029857 RepID=A0ABX4HRT4_9BACI|nr:MULTISPECIES: DNA mismatch repair protein MutS [Salimicrobium]PBB05932.1 DNA mismatch repair protein MutS [Salimicrobium humidisoli]